MLVKSQLTVQRYASVRLTSRVLGYTSIFSKMSLPRIHDRQLHLNLNIQIKLKLFSVLVCKELCRQLPISPQPTALNNLSSVEVKLRIGINFNVIFDF